MKQTSNTCQRTESQWTNNLGERAYARKAPLSLPLEWNGVKIVVNQETVIKFNTDNELPSNVLPGSCYIET